MNEADLKYTRQHEWVGMDGETAVIGITDHAQSELGDITYLELPAVGKTVAAGDELAVVESVKAASDICAPVGGTVAEVNDDLEAEPERVNKEPYGVGWICRLSHPASSDFDGLMSADEYKRYVEALA
jgi:glycine cleavage system H protein